LAQEKIPEILSELCGFGMGRGVIPITGEGEEEVVLPFFVE